MPFCVLPPCRCLVTPAARLGACSALVILCRWSGTERGGLFRDIFLFAALLRLRGKFSPELLFFNLRRFTVVYGFLFTLCRSLAVAPPFAACGGSVGLPLIRRGFTCRLIQGIAGRSCSAYWLPLICPLITPIGAVAAGLARLAARGNYSNTYLFRCSLCRNAYKS